MLRKIALLAILVAVLAPGAVATPRTDAVVARGGLTAAVEGGRLSAGSAARYRAVLDRAVDTQLRLPRGRAANLAGVLRVVASHADVYDESRALALFSMLDANTTYLATHALPAQRIDIEGPDGIVYRYFAGRGFQFHPLGNFARLNAHVSARRTEETRRLAEALVERAVPTGGGVTWEYFFAFGGPSRWTSGMAQAVAAQALARAGALVGDPALTELGRLAYAAVPHRLARPLAGGQWVRLYSFSDMAVLNAQLQAIHSVAEYAELAGDDAARAYAVELRKAARALLPRFDTGAWSLYALDGRESPLNYHDYVVALLRRLTVKTGEPDWRAVAARFAEYRRQPPVLQITRFSYRKNTRVVFRLSKVSRVTVRVGDDVLSVVRPRGTHVLAWKPKRSGPGVYNVLVSAVDLAGNVARLPPIVVTR